MNLLKAVVSLLTKDRRYRFRDRRAHYASDSLKCRRDRFWERTGVPATNPSDLTGILKMNVGKWIEDGLIENVIKNLHLEGVHMLSGQTPMGGSNPHWDGLLDAYVFERNDELGPYPVEIKTKSGAGADMFARNPDPGKDYLGQFGLYLKDLHEKTGRTRGAFLFLLLSDANFGEMIQVDCNYDPATRIVTAYRAVFINGTEKKIHSELDINIVLQRMQDVDKAVASGTEPSAGDYEYKTSLTPEFLSEVSDYQLKAAIDGKKVLGDWHVRYSRYFDKQVEVDRIERDYTDFERQQMIAEYKKRHPKSKVA